jgi:pimeloyl-ACP methyl ester carboxylesterase
MVSTRTTYIDAGYQDMSRPKERPPKTNWKIEALKKGVGVIQHISPRKASELVWSQFTKPGKSRFTENQKNLLAKASVEKLSYYGHEIVAYKWGSGPKVLLSHGWNSKIADFRRMIENLVDAGYEVHGIDMKAHGQSGGTHTALPEFRDILKNYYIKLAPFEAVVGYSIGGLAAGISMSELSPEFQPKKMFILAAPSHTRYFFHEIIKQLGYSEAVYNHMCGLVDEHYHQSVDYFDLRTKVDLLKGSDIHFIYCEDDETVPFERGLDLQKVFPSAAFVHTKGLGHYKIIAFKEVIDYLRTNLAD